MTPFRPQLPPRAGYVEVLAEDGVTHIYKATTETAAREEMENMLLDLLADQEYRLCLMELGV